MARTRYDGAVWAPTLAVLALAAPFEPVADVQVSCLENIRGKVGRARVEVVVAAGAVHESENERGVAHLLEHLVLRPLGFDDSNGATAWDFTTYHRDVRADELNDAAVELIRAIREPALTESAFDLEQEIVVRELLDRGTAAAERFVDPLFEGTILSRYPGGTERSVRALTLADARAFHERFYQRGNVAVVLRGAVDCAEIRTRLAPELAAFPDGSAVRLPRVDRRPPGRRSMPGSAEVFEAGFYWYDGTLEDEVIYRLVIEHLEQRALDDLRKERGLTYSPQGGFIRRAGGGQISLRVRTGGQASEVDAWYEDEVRDLIGAHQPRAELDRAFAAVREDLESAAVRNALAAIRGESQPRSALKGLSDARLQERLPALLAERRRFGTTTAQRNIGSIVVLALFGVVVLGAVYAAYRHFAS